MRLNTSCSKRAVSQIVGSLFMLAIVATIGSVILFQGLSGVNSFNNVITGFLDLKKDSTTESLIIEHVRLQQTPPAGSYQGLTCQCVNIWIRNTGLVDAKITTIKIIRTDDQSSLLNHDGINLSVPLRSLVSKNYSSSTSPSIAAIDISKTYKISITTERGNSFSALVTKENT
jgi:hypothetical protein